VEVSELIVEEYFIEPDEEVDLGPKPQFSFLEASAKSSPSFNLQWTNNGTKLLEILIFTDEAEKIINSSPFNWNSPKLLNNNITDPVLLRIDDFTIPKKLQCTYVKVNKDLSFKITIVRMCLRSEDEGTYLGMMQFKYRSSESWYSEVVSVKVTFIR
jgi:hypothetical protein